MHSQAPKFSGSTTRSAITTFRLSNRAPLLRANLLASLLAAPILVSTTGCGSGVTANTSSQATVVPTASAKGPQLGYMWIDSDKTLRPILGVPGASQVGQSVVPAGTYIDAAASSTAGIAILQATDGSFDLMTLPSGSPASLHLNLPAGAQIRLSAAATTALIYTPGATSASLVTGLLTAPQVANITAPSPIRDSAVSDTGSIALEYSQGSSVSVSVLGTGGRAVPIASIQSPGGLAFLPAHDDLLFADGSANSLTLIRSVTTAPSSSTLQTNGLLKSPSAVGVSGSGRWAIVANSASQTLVRVDLMTQSAVSIACACKPTQAATLADEGAFQVTNLTTGPNWIVDAAPSTPRTLFIPALPAPIKTSMVASVAAP